MVPFAPLLPLLAALLSVIGLVPLVRGGGIGVMAGEHPLGLCNISSQALIMRLDARDGAGRGHSITTISDFDNLFYNATVALAVPARQTPPPPLSSGLLLTWPTLQVLKDVSVRLVTFIASIDCPPAFLYSLPEFTHVLEAAEQSDKPATLRFAFWNVAWPVAAVGQLAATATTVVRRTGINQAAWTVAASSAVNAIDGWSTWAVAGLVLAAVAGMNVICL